MIKTKEGVTEIEGGKSEIMADLTMIIKVLNDKNVLSETDIDFCVATSRGSMSEIPVMALLGMLCDFRKKHFDEDEKKEEECDE